MPEYTFDPAAGEAVETRGGQPTNTRPGSESAFVEEKGFGTHREYEEAQYDRTAAGLAQRAERERLQRGLTDQDVDEGTYSYERAQLEETLQVIQQKLHRSTSPVEQAKLAFEAEAVAAKLIGVRQDEAPTSDQLSEDDFADAIRAELGDDVNEILANAAEVLDSGTAEEFNQVLSSDDKQAQKLAFNTLKAVKSNPEAFHTSREGRVGMNNEQLSRLTESVGAEVANDLHTISHMMAAGKLSTAQALATVAKSPAHLRALRTGVDAGIFKIML